ncbi:hypothetical protein HPB52_007664 [Rhipicephalus sanguineus]|uniref:Mutator-like transposase domain-containing protein n=1 Tax=Rhipicephalus sanguineus TaxID=34632 RepID=A0A9D4PW49_RHISA|nr:hypothetical protein HPB52_007664 [Rhipicephalus sanguineus]
MSSSNTQRAGKSSRDRGNKSPSAATTQSPKAVTATDGHAKPPDGFIPKVQPTPEQIRLAQIINDPTKQDDPDIKNKVQQVMEVTGQSSDAVVIALHDCDNDPTRAITMLIEGNKQEGEWETRGKKKKPVKEGNQQQQQQQQQKGDQGGPASSNKENRGGPRGEGGPPRNMPRGSSGGGRGGGRGGSWKNKEIEKNERNLEDGRTGERTGDMRPRGGSRRGGRGGRGGGVGGGRGSRTFQNRGLGGHDGFPQSMDTWTNSTSAGGQRASRGSQQQQQQQDTMAVGNWNDLAVSEDWSEEDWTGQLETKVFTASGAAAIPPPAPDTASIIQLLKESPHESISVAQYNQQATESIKAAVGVGSAANSVSNSSYPVTQVVSSADSSSVTTSKPVPAPQRTKTPRVRVPPPSKIPESAVEMPEDSAVSSLEVQFGGLEFGTDTFDFGAADGLAAVSTAQPTMPPGLVQTEQASVTASVPSSTPYMDGHHSVSKVPSSTVISSSPVGPMGPSSVASKDVSPTTAGAVPQAQSQQPSQQQSQQQSLPSQPSAAAPPSASLPRPPGIPAPKEPPQGMGNSVPPTANALGGAPASSATSAAVAASAASSASHKPGSVMAPEHLLLQSQSHSERSKPVSSSSVAGPQSKMYTGGAAAQRNSQGLEGGLSSAGKVEQPMYSSAGGGGQHYSGGAYPGGGGKGLVGSYLAHSQGFPSSTTGQQHYYTAQQPTSSTTAAFGQQQSNEEKVYGYVEVEKEDCVNHVQKRIGTALRNLVSRSKASGFQSLGGKGRLTADLITRLSSYYGWALKTHKGDVDAMHKAVMATYHHITSNDTASNHSFCPTGPNSWCRQNAAEARAAVAEAVLRFNAGNARATASILKELSLSPSTGAAVVWLKKISGAWKLQLESQSAQRSSALCADSADGPLTASVFNLSWRGFEIASRCNKATAHRFPHANMERRSFKKKRKTAQRFGARKAKPPIVEKKFSPATSASSDDGVWHDEDSQPSTSTHGASSASIDETVDMPLEQCFVPSEETSASRKRAAAVLESLRAVSATERKMSLIDQGDESDIGTEDEDEFFLVQQAALNGLLGSALCPQCKEPGLKMKHGTKHGLAVKMVLTCTACGADAKNAWSSPRMENSKSFEHDEVEDVQRAVMATFYHTTSTDHDPHHELCPPDPDSWCRHRAAEAKATFGPTAS